MQYARVFIDDISYQLAPRIISSDEIERRLEPVYKALRIPKGQLKAFTGIEQRRWWNESFRYSDGAIAAATKCLTKTNFNINDIGAIVYTGVCREGFEPATACRVAAKLGANSHTVVHDISNACLGALNGIIDIANRIELGQIKAGLVVSCESAHTIVESSIKYLLDNPTMSVFADTLATLTGGSGATAILITNGSFANNQKSQVLKGHKLVTVTSRTSAADFEICHWGMQAVAPGLFKEIMTTDATSLLKKGMHLGNLTWQDFLVESGWQKSDVDKLICHQIGSVNRKHVLEQLNISEQQDFITFPTLGNMGTVSLPVTAAMATEQNFLKKNDKVAFLGIGSGLSCIMMGLEW
ncbi:3-oxoacyl-ACP synthase III [Candidatus Colwellia aromaticivorans]|uniref:3-oxoacyl-ACP synthase III n=1 Tax=Candidatus Colwellia aromaticivorans TaxID=2267621 RepID=UPI000DF11824|nr:3-oxoacyl-ACP synthase III [Candidatus Colwellia aromaticivorans]